VKHTLAFLLTLCMVFSFCTGTTAFAAAPDRDIVVLYTNDVHCGINDNLGYETLGTLKNLYSSAGNTVLLADCGDAVQGAPVGTLSRGEYIIDIMNELGYDVACIGNHELDYGIEQLKANVAKAAFPYVSCNFVDAEGNAVLQPCTIMDVNGIKLAFVGISTPKTMTSTVSDSYKNEDGEWVYGFCMDSTGEALYNRVQETVDAAKADGADYVIALAHLGIDESCSPWMSSDVIAHTTGIDVMLDGHSHSVIENEKVKNAEGRDVILSSTGTQLANIGCLTIGADGSVSSFLINDNGISQFIEDIEARYEELVNQVVAHTDVDLVIYDPATGERMIRQNETNLGDLCADAYRAMAGAEIALVNGGCIRNDIPAGDITYGQILSVHPFGNELCVIEATGAEILDALEFSVSKLPGESGGFFQVSGMSYTIDMSVNSTVELDENTLFKGVTGARRIQNVMVGNEPIDPDETYILASHEFILKSNGDGYSMFSDNVLLQDCVMIDSQILTNYITKVLGGTVGEEYADVYGQGRITIING